MNDATPTSTSTTLSTSTSLRAMIWLDIENLATWRRPLPLILALLLVMSFNGMQMTAVMLYVFGFLITMNAFTMDSNHQLQMLYATLPITRRQVVTSHYLVGLGTLATSVVLVLPCALVASMARGTAWADEAWMGVGTILVTSMVMTVMLPFAVHFGTKAMAYAALALMGVAAGASMLAPRLGHVPQTMADTFTVHPGPALGAFAAILALAWIASWALSCYLFERKDF